MVFYYYSKPKISYVSRASLELCQSRLHLRLTIESPSTKISVQQLISRLTMDIFSFYIILREKYNGHSIHESLVCEIDLLLQTYLSLYNGLSCSYLVNSETILNLP